ncbi:hypothetical protein BP6252_10233 [Coleophoma cylindrospora]|uniref:O-methyltransferase C-terminal domain-containing protein n=1 Tax=Coleophoma cylindrospora TaxID=1849047 RepID=A0A3D8QS13_9HELO|nr:hypothetical protein BP6252_10233 [Coleophoma cylindrospora]
MDAFQNVDPLYPTKEEVSPLLQQILVKGLSLEIDNPKSRKDLMETARSLFLALETPMEAILRMGWAEKPLMSLIYTAMNLNLFVKMNERDAAPKSCNELAEMTDSDPILLGRILKHLSAMSFIKETGPDVYAHTRLSKSMLNPAYSSGVPFLETAFSDIYRSLPKFLSDTQYRNCTNPMKSGLQAGHNTTLHAFEFFTNTPGLLEDFNNHMAGYSMSRLRWIDKDCYPIEQNLGIGLSKDQGAVLLVDIGGGTGHDIMEFHKQHSSLSGRLILQDTPAVIASTKDLPDRIEKMSYDFFTEQPIKGARAYYLHSILHDWPDSKCLDILRNLKPALKKGYSKILVNENVIPAQDAHYTTTGLDIMMLSCFASMERTEGSWRKLIAEAGLKIVAIWTYERGTESLIEIELA